MWSGCWCCVLFVLVSFCVDNVFLLFVVVVAVVVCACCFCLGGVLLFVAYCCWLCEVCVVRRVLVFLLC